MALETLLWQSSPRGRQCLWQAAGLKSSFKAASPFSQHRPSHNTSYPKVLILQVQLSFPQERGAEWYARQFARSRVCPRQRTATSNHLPPRQELSNLSRTQKGIQHLPSSVLQNTGKCSVDVGQPNKAAQLCLLRAHLSPQAACKPCLAQQSRRERQRGIKMPQWPLTAYSKNSDGVLRYCNISGCHLLPFLYARLAFLERTFSTQRLANELRLRFGH